MPTFGAFCFGHFSVAECAEVSVSTLQAQLDSYICTETLPQADPTSVANAVGTVTLVREGGISAFESLHPLLTIQKNVCRRNPVSRSGVVMWGFVVGFWHIYSLDDGTGEIFVGWFTLNWKCVINVSGHRCSFIYSSALKASALFWNTFCHLVFWRRGRRTAV